MKTQRLLTPLAFVVAATLSAGVSANGGEGGGNGSQGHNVSSAAATINDAQVSGGNSILNQGTENNGSVNDSLGGASGNVGVNVAAGNNNQQANAAAISTADAEFVFGRRSMGATADATINVTQLSRDNVVTNYSTPNNAS